MKSMTCSPLFSATGSRLGRHRKCSLIVLVLAVLSVGRYLAFLRRKGRKHGVGPWLNGNVYGTLLINGLFPSLGRTGSRGTHNQGLRSWETSRRIKVPLSDRASVDSGGGESSAVSGVERAGSGRDRQTIRTLGETSASHS